MDWSFFILFIFFVTCILWKYRSLHQHIWKKDEDHVVKSEDFTPKQKSSRKNKASSSKSSKATFTHNKSDQENVKSQRRNRGSRKKKKHKNITYGTFSGATTADPDVSGEWVQVKPRVRHRKMYEAQEAKANVSKESNVKTKLLQAKASSVSESQIDIVVHKVAAPNSSPEMPAKSRIELKGPSASKVLPSDRTVSSRPSSLLIDTVAPMPNFLEPQQRLRASSNTSSGYSSESENRRSSLIRSRTSSTASRREPLLEASTTSPILNEVPLSHVKTKKDNARDGRAPAKLDSVGSQVTTVRDDLRPARRAYSPSPLVKQISISEYGDMTTGVDACDNYINFGSKSHRMPPDGADINGCLAAMVAKQPLSGEKPQLHQLALTNAWSEEKLSVNGRARPPLRETNENIPQTKCDKPVAMKSIGSEIITCSLTRACPVARYLPTRPFPCCTDVDSEGKTLELHGCKLEIPAYALSTMTRIGLERFYQPSVVREDVFVISPTLRCVPCGQRFARPVQITLPTCYTAKHRSRPVKAIIQHSRDCLRWESIKEVLIFDQRSVAFESRHFSAFRMVVRDGTSCMVKQLSSCAFIKRHRNVRDTDRYVLIWCIHDDDPGVTDKLQQDMKSTDDVCYDRVIPPQLFTVEQDSWLKLRLMSRFIDIHPHSDDPVVLDADTVWSHQLDRKPQFCVMQSSERKQLPCYIIDYVISTVTSDVLQNQFYLIWHLSVQRQQPVSRNISANCVYEGMNVTVGNGGTGFSIDQNGRDERGNLEGNQHFALARNTSPPPVSCVNRDLSASQSPPTSKLHHSLSDPSANSCTSPKVPVSPTSVSLHSFSANSPEAARIPGQSNGSPGSGSNSSSPTSESATHGQCNDDVTTSSNTLLNTDKKQKRDGKLGGAWRRFRDFSSKASHKSTTKRRKEENK